MKLGDIVLSFSLSIRLWKRGHIVVDTFVDLDSRSR